MLERRSSAFFSLNADVVDSSSPQVSPEKQPSKVSCKTAVPVINVTRYKTTSETEYADTEVSKMVCVSMICP